MLLKINNEWRGHERWAITHEDFIRDNPDVIKRDHIDLRTTQNGQLKLSLKLTN